MNDGLYLLIKRFLRFMEIEFFCCHSRCLSQLFLKVDDRFKGLMAKQNGFQNIPFLDLLSTSLHHDDRILTPGNKEIDVTQF